MNLSSKTYTLADFTFEDALKVILSHPLCDPLIKNSYPTHPRGPVVGLSYGSALAFFRAEVRKQTVGSGHPTAVLLAQATEHPIVVTPTAISVVAQKPVDLAYQRGYFVDTTNQEAARMIACKAHVADMLAYTFTPSQPLDSSRVCDSNFTKDFSKVGVPLVTGMREVNNDFKARDAAGNGYKIFAQIKGAKEWLALVQATEALTGCLAKQGFPSQTQNIICKIPVKTPSVYTPPAKACPTAEMAYKVLDRHRGCRGEDRKWLSPLTSGYYIGAMPRAIEEVWWRVADIVHVAKSVKASTIVLGPQMGLNLARSIASNGYVVFYVANSNMDFLTETERQEQLTKLKQGHGVHLPYSTLDAAKVLAAAELYVDVGMKASFSFSNKIIVETKAWQRHFASLVSREQNWMTWWGVTDVVLSTAKKNKVGVEFSVHAHSGQAIFIKCAQGPSVWTEDKAYAGPRHYSRMVTANVYKTHFPYARRRFWEVDVAKYGFNNLAIARLHLAVNITRKAKVEIELQDDDGEIPAAPDDQFVDPYDIEVPVAIVANDQAFSVPIPVAVRPPARLSDSLLYEVATSLSSVGESDLSTTGGDAIDGDEEVLEDDVKLMGHDY